MAVRPIDGERLKGVIQQWIDTQSEFFDTETCESVLNAIDVLPTLTPPNEPLTCAGCYYLDRVYTPCAHCRRTTGYADYYLRPPEGEEDT